MNDFENTLLITTIVIAIVVLILVATIFIFDFKVQKRFDNLIKDSSNSLRVYSIDFSKGEVTYFNRSNLRKKTNVSLAQFYNHFISSEREGVMVWLQNLLNNEKETQPVKEVHVISKHRKSNLYSLLQVESIDSKNQRIILSSYLLKSCITKKNKKDTSYKLTTLDHFNKYLSTYSKGYSFIFNFFDKRNADNQIPRLSFLQLINIFNSYVSLYRLIVEYGSHQIIVSDFRASSRHQIMQLINIIKSDIHSQLMISSLEDKIGFNIGICENKYFDKKPDLIFDTLFSLIDAGIEDKQEIVWYQKGRKIKSELDGEAYRTEVERLIRDKKIRYTFRPIIDLNNSEILGYQSFAEPLDSFFGSMKELKTYAARTDDDRPLFAANAKNIITRFSHEKDGDVLRLFFPLNNYEKNYVNRTLPHIQNIKSIHMVLVYYEQELVDLANIDDDSIVTEIKTFKSKGYEVALELNDNDLTLSPNIYGSFDFFVVDANANLKIGNKFSQRALYNFRGLVEKLLKYNRPIVAADIPDWDSVELMKSLGINLVSSEVISPKDENVLPIPLKSVMKIKNIKNK